MATYLTDVSPNRVSDATLVGAVARAVISEWIACDPASDAQKRQLDEYVRAGVLSLDEACEVRYKWFRKGEFAGADDWREWCTMIETNASRAWRAYRRQKKL